MMYLLVFALFLRFAFAQDQQYFFGGPQARFVPNYHHQQQQHPGNDYINYNNRPQQPTSYQEESINSFYQPQTHRDLQTSDLPLHLQHTLPQYRFNGQSLHQQQQQQQEKPQHFISPSFQASSPRGFHPATSQYNNNAPIVPSTHRPNYSHLFKSHRDSQKETFLGEITLDGSAELPPDPFKPFSSETWKDDHRFPDNSVDENHHKGSNQFLNQRTRVFAPLEDHQFGGNGNAKIKDYFISRGGEGFNNKATRSTTPVPPTTFRRRLYPIIQTTERNIDSLLEDVRDNRNNNNNHKNYVEVVQGQKPITLSPDKFFTLAPPNVSSKREQRVLGEKKEDEDDEEVEEEEVDKETIDDTDGEEDDQQEDEKQEDDHQEDEEEESTADYDYKSENNASTEKTSAKSYDVLTMKPSSMVKDENFKGFIDSTVIDTTENLDVTTLPPLVSIVTTKSVINNTILTTDHPPTILPTLATPTVENTSDSWVVVASVQTSRSVSGARYLPNAVVEQEIKTKLLNADLETTTFVTIDDGGSSRKPNSSTESLIDKLDRAQSDLSSSLLSGFSGNNITVINENPNSNANNSATTVMDMELSTSAPPRHNGPNVVIKKFSPNGRPPLKQPKTQRLNRTNKVSKNETPSSGPLKINANVTTKVIPVDISKFLPPGFKAKEEVLQDQPKTLLDILLRTTESPQVEIAGLKIKQGNLDLLLPPGYKPTASPKSANTSIKSVNASTVPKQTTPKPNKTSTLKPTSEPISTTTPTIPSTTNKKDLNPSILKSVTLDDISAFLPPGYKLPMTTTAKPAPKLVAIDDISAFLPKDYNVGKTTTTEKPKTVLKGVTMDDVSAFLPPGYRGSFKPKTTTKKPEVATTESTTTPMSSTTVASFKVVFPSRPGSGTRKSFGGRLTTPKSVENEGHSVVEHALVPAIQKGWPTRATTEFTGWPTPSTTPISIEKLLEAARNATLNLPSSTSSTTTPEPSSTTSTTTTTTPKPTTPGYCVKECDLAGTIKLIGGAKWVPELLDRNTREWQILANEVQSQLDDVFSKSNVLNKWYKKIRIDGFSEGSVLVDYLVELNDLGRQVDTLEIRKLFHDSLGDAANSAVVAKSSLLGSREAKSSDINPTTTDLFDGKLNLGNFVLDPKYTDFIVLPKQMHPTVGMADENVLLPQWAIAVIVIGLASLLFVIIFGVTVLVNRQKSAKKKAPSPLTEDMLNELNKNHMGGGIDNYAADDLYNMEDVWNDRHPYDLKYQKKRSTGSLHENSMANLYDSWRSEWNGHYYNTGYYGNGNHAAGSSHSGGGGGYGRRRSDYDTNF